MLRRSRTVAAPLALAVAVALVGGPLASEVGSSRDDPLDTARRAAERLSFVAEVTVHWRDAGGMRSQRLQVRAAGGVLTLDGPADVLDLGGQRLVAHDEQGWSLLWPASWRRPMAPALGHRYVAEPRGAGPAIAGRATMLVVVRESGRRGQERERLALDASTGLLLRREQLNEAGTPVRVVSMERLELGRPARPPRSPSEVIRRQLNQLGDEALGPPFWVPRRLGADYQLMGAYRRDGMVHALYGDGLYAISVFEQPGRLVSRQLPAGSRPVGVGPWTGRHWAWPGGNVVTWQAGDSVHTLVGDGPLDELLAAAAALPASRQLSSGQRLRRASRTLLAAISWRP